MGPSLSWGVALVWSAAVTSAVAAEAAQESFLDDLEPIVLERARWESWRFFDPGAPGGDPDYDFGASQLRFGLRWERPHFTAEAAGQYVQLFSVPDDAAGSPGGALGAGALYFVHSDERSPEAFQLKYLNAEMDDFLLDGLRLQVGRFGYSSGHEADSGSAKIEAVKASRIADRLIGEFGWSHFQRSFDGARLDWDHGLGQFTAAAFRPTEGGFEDGGTDRIDKIDLATAAWTLAPGVAIPGAELQAFYVRYDDERLVRARPDNTGLSPPGRQDLEIHTFGGHFVGAWRFGPGEVDLLGWGAVQIGDWFEQDHHASAAALEGGYQLSGSPMRPWIRFGGFRSTGDGDPRDEDHETFFQILPTARIYSKTATYNLMNSTDVFGELRLFPTERLTVVTDVHGLWLSSDDDLWYAGAGATQSSGTIFGFAGRPSGGHSTLGAVAELTLRYAVTDFLDVHFFYGHFFGGTVVETSFADGDDLDFLFLELTVRPQL